MVHAYRIMDHKKFGGEIAARDEAEQEERQ
jgi:hypothetical protein